VPQPTTLPRAPLFFKLHSLFNVCSWERTGLCTSNPKFWVGCYTKNCYPWSGISRVSNLWHYVNGYPCSHILARMRIRKHKASYPYGFMDVTCTMLPISSSLAMSRDSAKHLIIPARHVCCLWVVSIKPIQQACPARRSRDDFWSLS
jgi:hypothetical protein